MGMNDEIPIEKPVSNWAVAGGLVVFALAFLLWALGFDAVAGWIQGGSIEAVLNWLSTAWLWLGVAVVVIALAVGSLGKH